MVQGEKGMAAVPPKPRAERQPPATQASIDEAFTVFFNTHYEPLLSFATYWGKDVHDADDAIAMVMEYLYRHWDDIRQPLNYAHRAVTRTILKIRRDRGEGRCVPASDHLLDGADVAIEFDQMEGEQWVADLLAELPPTQYAVLSRFLDGLSLKEISEELRKSESTIRQNLKLARDRLLPHVKEYDRRTPCPSVEQKTREENR